MKNISKLEIARAQAAAADIARHLAAIESNDHALERQALTDELLTYLRPAPGRTMFNLAHEILDNKIEATIADFLVENKPFYNREDTAKIAAENCDLVAALNHERNNLIGVSPSIDSARQLLGIFNEFLTSSEGNAMAEKPNEKETPLSDAEAADESALAGSDGEAHPHPNETA